MRSDDENLMRFVRRVHRRLMLVRAAERSGACVAVASVFACAFASVALVQGRDAMQLVVPTLALGAIVGIVWGFARRPTRFDAVVEADRQLQLSDLLATAYARRASDDPWPRAVVAIADQRCRSLSPATVVVHRYGGRAWGGIGLSAALGLTLALLSGVPQDSRARPAEAKRTPASAEATTARPEMPEIQATGLSDAARAKIAAAAEAESRAGVGSATDITDAASGTPADNVFTRPGKEGSGGERAGETSAATGDTLPRPSGGTANEQVADATTVAGGGAATPVPPAGGPAGSMGKAAGASSSRDASVLQQSPPWSSPSWDADRAAAGEAIKSGRVPDAYRDVVSEYFRDGDDDRSGR